jgi:hypothetical protein
VSAPSPGKNVSRKVKDLALLNQDVPMEDDLDLRRYAPATQRNREPILEVLRQVLPPTGTILEISSGTGEHAVFLAPQLAPRYWLPSDPNPDARASITAWNHSVPCDNIYPPIDLDASSFQWLLESKDPITAIVNINMIHIAPRSAYLGLFAGASRILPVGGILYLYGPFKQDGVHTAPSNAAFESSESESRMGHSRFGRNNRCRSKSQSFPSASLPDACE